MNTSPANEDHDPTSEPKLGPELMDRIVQHPTLDDFLDRNPHSVPLNDEELDQVIRFERLERAKWNVKLEKAEEKRNGG